MPGCCHSGDSVVCLEPCPPGTSRGVRVITSNVTIFDSDARGVPRRHAVVTASDASDEDDTTRVLRADVWVAPVRSVEIQTIVEVLAVKSSEQVTVTGKDESDNTFSTLEVSPL